MTCLRDEELIDKVHQAALESPRDLVRANHLDVPASGAAIGMALVELEEDGLIDLHWKTARGNLYEVPTND